MPGWLWESWKEYYELEPWGFPAEDLRGGMLAAVIARSMGATDIAPRTFMLRPPPEPEPEDVDPDDQVRWLKSVMGG
jgi:hypothetical protein